MAKEVEYLLRLQSIGLIVTYAYASNLCLEISQAFLVFQPNLVVHLVLTTRPQSIMTANIRGKKPWFDNRAFYFMFQGFYIFQ